ncbi:hypothetical protein SAMN02910356_00403 [Selenomonas sp. GACV-9]|nr:hypothetical protein SAMN02910356_00403 [Selenomonas ruminantium]
MCITETDSDVIFFQQSLNTFNDILPKLSIFETKDELLKALCTEIFEHVFSDELTQEKTHDFSTEKKDIKAEITHILNHMICDFAETVRWWMEHDQYSPEEISRFFFSTTPFA